MDRVSSATVKTVAEYDVTHNELMIHAIRRQHSPKTAAKLINRFLARRARKDFNYVNVHSRREFREQLQVGAAMLWPKLAKDEVALALFTFVDRDWVTNERVYKVDLRPIKQKVRNALGGISFIAAIEFALYSNQHKTVNGISAKLLSVHVHAIAWDTSHRQLERRRQKMARRFKPAFNRGERAVDCSRRVGVSDFLDTISYMSKCNLTGYRLGKPGQPKQQPCRVSLTSHVRFFEQLRDESLFDFWFAGGQGAEILSGAKAACLRKRAYSDDDITCVLEPYLADERDRRARRVTKRMRQRAASAQRFGLSAPKQHPDLGR